MTPCKFIKCNADAKSRTEKDAHSKTKTVGNESRPVLISVIQEMIYTGLEICGMDSTSKRN